MAKDKRCSWCLSDPLYERYHDEEWGVPVYNSRDLYERLVLEGMQAGLSWLTVLKKRAHMQDTFFGFSPERLAAAQENDLQQWLADAGVIRHRGKLEAMINNAQLMLNTDNFADYLWSFVDGKVRVNRHKDRSLVPSVTPQSEAMAKSLKKLGFRFVGPTICYAFMQSAGLVNDHVTGCPRHRACAQLAG